ncbi:ABC transporter substrate-binding protein [Kineococcus rhizosphaerae]|uniref:Peptide/nickel transport system substrate-binding protein n=1 Tax=Kineococcus rhizosphaerae TaxID=559628 RepID=A0A2T0R158_9ACTN|nr:ABC transporter substrate-binding protein [Kineococcus rhizosphaerae]PRY13064.1 peptide/nickel transport system substrate-binding protein [Kineococcus rhizosphaerae]
MPRRITLSALALSAALALAACSAGSNADSPAGADASRAADAKPVDGGTLTFDVASDAGCVDPQQVGSNETIYATRQFVDSLTDQDPETGTIEPWLAKSWDVSPDGTTFTFHLVTGATFSDGTPVDAAAVKANLDAATKLGARATLVTNYLTGYVGADVVDPQTVKVTFSAPNAQFLQATSTFSLGLVSVASTRQSPDERCKGIVGSGPFTLDHYTQGKEIVLKKRADYDWGSSLWTTQGAAHLDGITFQIVPEASVRSGSLQSQQVDAISSLSPQDLDLIESTGGHVISRTNPGIPLHLAVNNSRPATSDVKVREAISRALDRQEVIDTVLSKQYEPATSVLSDTTPGYADESELLTTDQAKAKQLLDEAGWEEGTDGVREKDGQKLNLDLYWFNNGNFGPTTELFQQQLKKVGIGVTIHQAQISEAAQVQKDGNFDLIYGGLTRADGDILRTSYSTKGTNNARIPVTELDDVLAQQLATVDVDQRNALLAKAQQLIVSNYYVIPVVQQTTVLATTGDVHDLDFEASSRLQFHDTWKG